MENEKEIPENGCPEEQAAEIETTILEEQAAEIETTIPEVNANPEKKKSGTGKIILITVASTIVALALLGAMFFWYSRVQAFCLQRKPDLL